MNCTASTRGKALTLRVGRAIALAALWSAAAWTSPLTLYDLLHAQRPTEQVGVVLRQPVGPLTAGDGVSVAADDWDGDGDVDLFAGSQYGDLLYFENVEPGPKPVYAAAIPLRLDVPSGQGRRGSCAPKVIDWDGDESKDLFVCLGGEFLVCRAPDVRSTEPLHTTPAPVPSENGTGLAHASSAQPMDWDGDGLLDLVVGTTNGRLLLMSGEGNSAFHQFSKPRPFLENGEPLRLGADVQVCAWTDDKRPARILTGSKQAGLLLVRAAEGGGPLDVTTSALSLGDAGAQPSLARPSPALARSADGRDILFVGTAAGFVEAFTVGAGQALQHIGRVQQRDAPIDVGTFSAPVLAEWDDDDIPDLIVGSDEGVVWFFRGADPRRGAFLKGERIEAAGKPIRLNEAPGTRPYSYVQPLVLDWDSDGLPDLLVSGDEGYIWLYENRGQPGRPRLRPPRQLKMGRTPIRQAGPVSMAVHDWNLDGDLDLFVGSGAHVHPEAGALVPKVANGGMVYYENIAPSPKLPPRFFKGARLDCKVPVVFPAAAIRDAAALDLGIVGVTDWDGDGQRDFLLSAQGGIVYLFRTNTSHHAYPELELAANLNSSLSAIIAEDVYAPSLADVNGDGRDDLLAGMNRYGFVRWCDRRSLASCPPSVTTLSGPHPFTAVDLSAPIFRDGAVTDWRIAIGPDNTRPEYRLKIFRREGNHLAVVGESGWHWVKPGWNLFSCNIPGVRRGDLVGFASGKEGETTAVLAARAGKTLYVPGREVSDSRAVTNWEAADMHLAIEVTVR